jgi:DNA-binding NarL/FixJ family response regulator
MEKITILIADDHALVRESWSFMLNTDPRFEVVAESGTCEEAIEQVKEMRPDIVIMDISMPGMNGIEATGLIRKFSPGSKILGISMHTQPVHVRKMMQNGAMGYITKNSSRTEMLKAIVEIQNEREYICDEIKSILSGQAMNNEEQQMGVNSLSKREIEIIEFIKNGDSSKQIAETLSLSVKTVEVHRYNILRKLNLRNSAAMVNYINNSQLSINN